MLKRAEAAIERIMKAQRAALEALNA